ncbi:TRAP transporter substrate-binding protein [Oceanobacillus jeddahense]|uniref:TRAP transporter substrate-binding protein n=1 Tax=Oceanobacillus jeddahense TaxID=1462527 RepID=UPI000595926B|nr:TRAP transporter substrate-binding protein [Oceanobacillus jeddahense]
MRKLFTLIIMVLIILTGCSSISDNNSSESDVIEFNLALENAENTNYYQGAKKMAEEVALATDNQIQINIHAGGTLGGERDTVEQTLMGDLDMAMVSNSVLSNFIPEMNILDRAFLFDNAEQAHTAVDGPVGDLIEEEAENIGLKVVGYMESGYRNIFANRPITSVEDFQGLKIRTMQNQYHMAAFESFGAIPLSLAASEQFTALQQGTVDALENAVSNALAGGYYEIAKDITTIDYAYVFILVTMSEESWEQIPEHLQEPFLEGVKKGYEAQRQYLLEANQEAVEELENLGVTFHEIDQSELRDRYQSIEAEKGFEFDPKWQEAVDEVIGSTNSTE